MKINIKVVEASYNVCTSGLVHKLDPIDDWSGCMAFSLSSTEPGHVPAIHSGNSTFFHEEAEKISMGWRCRGLGSSTCLEGSVGLLNSSQARALTQVHRIRKMDGIRSVGCYTIK